jgi:hypothetical protein
MTTDLEGNHIAFAETIDKGMARYPRGAPAARAFQRPPSWRDSRQRLSPRLCMSAPRTM